MDKTPHLKAIVAAMLVSRPSCNAKVEGDDITVEGRSIAYWCKWDEQRDHISTWRSKPNGKFYLRVDGWGWRSRGGYLQPARIFPVRKDGTMNYAEIADAFLMRLSHELHKEDKASVEEANRPIVQALREELGEYSSPLGYMTACGMRAGHVKIKLEKSVSVEQARAIAAILSTKS